MNEVPIGKALVPVEVKSKDGCYLYDTRDDNSGCVGCHFACTPNIRKDGKNVIFKLADYPAKEEL